jgi:rhodanese-related sulfurtransferase
MIAQIRPTDLAAWFAAQHDHGAPVVLDVREPAELQTARVTANGFELIALPMGSIPQQLAQLDAKRPVACLCHHGARSMRVAVFLENQGFTRVANVAGGIDAWSLELDPTVARY